MKILYGITKSNWGGAQRYVYDLALGAKKAGHEVFVLCGGSGPLVERLREEKIRVITLPSLERDVRLMSDIKIFANILSLLRRERMSIFHINSSKMGIIGALAGRLVGVEKIIFTAHGWAFNESRPWIQKFIIKKLAWLTVLLSHKVICVSEAIKRDVERLPFVRGKLFLIHNGLDKFSLRPREERGHIVIGTIAELHPIKGLDMALRGFARAFKYTDARLEIIGSGEERENLETLAKELGIESQTDFAGFKENARELLRRFDIFILTSRSEGLPYVLLEAGLAGLPIIATRVGGIPEIITDGETGLLIPKEDPVALAEALKKLSYDGALQKRLSNNLKTFVQNNFSLNKMLAETFKLYH